MKHKIKKCPHCKKDLIPHGLTRYQYGCRCEICKTANKVYGHDYRNDKKKRLKKKI